MAKKECEYCRTQFQSEKGLYLKKNNKMFSADFCSYECYLSFWDGVETFQPLEEEKAIELEKHWWEIWK